MPETTVTRIDDCAQEGDYIEVIDNHDYEPGIELHADGWVNLDAEGVDKLIIALAKSQDHTGYSLLDLAREAGLH